MQEENLEFKNIFESVTDPESAKIMKSLSDKLIKAREELETLRASNTIKQANIELLEAENANLKLHKEYDQALDRLITERDSLLEQNAKLIADRDELREQLSVVRNGFEGISWPYHHCYELLKYAGIDFSGSAGESIVYAVKRLLAEREGMMTALMDAKKFAEWIECLGRTDCEVYKHELKANADLAIERIEQVLGYTNQLPAQQIPEGYKFENKKGHIVVTCPDLSQEIIYADEPLFELISMLSASQPK